MILKDSKIIIMSNSEDKRWEEKDDGISTLLRQQNEELIKKYEDQCQIAKGLAKENDELFNKRRKYTVAISEIKKIINNI